MSANSSTTILIVDDNIGARRAIEGLLAPERYQIHLAENGVEALQKVSALHPDLILLDVMMPGMSGYEVCARIRDQPDVSDIPIIMITALDDDESMIKGINAGADDFLTKPINKIELRSRVRGVSRLNRYRKLCDERHKFEWVVQNSTFGYMALDSEERIVFANPQVQEMLKMPTIDARAPIDFFEAISPRFVCKPDNLKARWANANAPEKSAPFHLIQPISAKEGTRWIQVTAFETDPTVSGSRLLQLEDISDRMRSFQEKQTFSSMITHKLLTPLNALKASQQMLNVSAGADTQGLLKRVSELQNRGIERLEYDIDSIIRYLESNSLSKKGERTSLNAMAAIVNAVGQESRTPFTLKSSFGDFASWGASISLYNFETCVREIFENANKFHPHQAPSLECEALVLNDPPTVEFIFRNDGEPLTDDELQNAWSPFWQADRHATGEIRGMGLGLSFIATHIWASGGNCSIANREDRNGAVVAIAMPIGPKPAAPPADDEPQPQGIAQTPQ